MVYVNIATAISVYVCVCVPYLGTLQVWTKEDDAAWYKGQNVRCWTKLNENPWWKPKKRNLTETPTISSLTDVKHTKLMPLLYGDVMESHALPKIDPTALGQQYLWEEKTRELSKKEAFQQKVRWKADAKNSVLIVNQNTHEHRIPEKLQPIGGTSGNLII